MQMYQYIHFKIPLNQHRLHCCQLTACYLLCSCYGNKRNYRTEYRPLVVSYSFSLEPDRKDSTISTNRAHSLVTTDTTMYIC